MQDIIHSLSANFRSENPATLAEVEELRIKYLGKNGSVTQLFLQFRSLSPDEKRSLGPSINQLKAEIQEGIQAWQIHFKHQSNSSGTSHLDLTRPGLPHYSGTLHPLRLLQDRIEAIFHSLGFSTVVGPELEDDFHVFGALNFPPDHPARDMQDTFFIQKDLDILLRTHTSSIQVRTMMGSKPPIRVICPGRVYRNEDVSARAHCQFHQVEGLYVDRAVSFADLKQMLLLFAQHLFGPETSIRLRPSFFPFTEPSVEVDVSCNLCGGKGCNVCKHTGWLEILGAGMVHPNVLKSCGIDSNIYSGYAFGMGIERVAMLLYGVNDIRLFFENDLRFLTTFSLGA